jgi:hypothetical protein
MSAKKVYKAGAFRSALPERVRRLLPEEWQHFEHRSRFSLVQFWYEEPAFHYEFWPHSNMGRIEVGLHFEHPQSAQNATLHRFFDERFVEIRHELGEVWLEQWDRGWHKLYATLPYEQYTEILLQQVSHALARQITVLQPYLEIALREIELQ